MLTDKLLSDIDDNKELEEQIKHVEKQLKDIESELNKLNYPPLQIPKLLNEIEQLMQRINTLSKDDPERRGILEPEYARKSAELQKLKSYIPPSTKTEIIKLLKNETIYKKELDFLHSEKAKIKTTQKL